MLEVPNLLLTNIAVYYVAVFLVRLQKMCFNISSEALKAMSVYFIYYTIWIYIKIMTDVILIYIYIC